MKVLVLGSGAKDYAMAWWFSKSRVIEGLYIAPGNAATEVFAKNLPDTDPADKEQVFAACQQYGIDFVFIGTEAPLLNGVVDYLHENNIATFGAPEYALKLESDRQFAREFAKQYNIPIPEYHIFSKSKDLKQYLKDNCGLPYTIKSNKLGPSRQIIHSSDPKDLLAKADELFKLGPVILEEHVEGLPVTVSAFLDDSSCLLLPFTSEYTKRSVTDTVTETGGMGAVCPIPLQEVNKKKMLDEIINPTIRGLREKNLYYKGVITFSTVVSSNGVCLVDYHVRLNDPATQTFVPLIKNDVVEIMNAIQSNTLSSIKLETNEKYAVSVIVGSEGYPEKPKTGMKIKNITGKLLENTNKETCVFFGAIETGKDKNLYTSGGRPATVVGISDSIIKANEIAYKTVPLIDFKGAWYRSDIGNNFIEQNESSI